MSSKRKNRKRKTPNKKHKNPKNGLDRISKNFKDLFILLISILHGELFFLITNYSLDILENFNLIKLSKIILFYSVFFRIFQTQLLAALKYDRVWKVKIYDFIIVFITVLFEFLFFSVFYKETYPFIKGYILMIIFALFGIFGYVHTFFMYKRGTTKLSKSEKKIQTINICILIIVLMLSAWVILYPSLIMIMIFNYIISILLLLNIGFSLTISDEKIFYFKKRKI